MYILVRQWQFDDAGVATAFAAKDVMGNMLCGVGLQFSRPFSIGDSITVHFVDPSSSFSFLRIYILACHKIALW